MRSATCLSTRVPVAGAVRAQIHLPAGAPLQWHFTAERGTRIQCTAKHSSLFLANSRTCSAWQYGLGAPHFLEALMP
eukprot:4191749-Amphidinium_carterae.1